jgi:hypothetical protein
VSDPIGARIRAAADATGIKRNRGTCGGACGSRRRRCCMSGGDASRAARKKRRTLPVATSPRDMARGFESKSVEAQQEAAAEERRHMGPPVDRENAARRAERATLTLARIRAEADLKGASAPAHRAMLQQAIADLDRRIAAMDDSTA